MDENKELTVVGEPVGLNKFDTIEDALKRADSLSDPDGKSYSGMMTERKDLRRIVLLTREYRKLKKGRS